MFTLRLSKYSPIYTMLIGLIIIQFATPFAINTLMSVGTWIVVLSSLMALIIGVYRLKKNMTIGFLVLCIATLISFFLGFDYTYTNIVSLFCFLELPIFMMIYTDEVSEDIVRFIYRTAVMLSIFYNVLSFTSYCYLYRTEYGDRYLSFATLGFKNPNETAMFLTVTAIILLSFMVKAQKKIAKMLLILDFIALCRLIYLTDCRTALFVISLYLCMVVISRNKNIPKQLPAIVIALCFIFIIAIMLLGGKSSFIFMNDVVDTGRFNIYNSAISNLNFNKVVFGDFSYRFSNLHNGFLSIFITIGAVGLIAVIYLLLQSTRNMLDYNQDKKVDKPAVIGFLCLILYTSTEAAFITTGSSYAVFMFCVFYLGLSGKRRMDLHEGITNQYCISQWQYRKNSKRNI